MAVLGVGMGLIVSQLGNVVQSSVDASGRGEAGGLQYTGQQLGSSLGVALIGAIVLTGLTGTFLTKIEGDERISAEVAAQVTVAAGSGIDFVASEQIGVAAQDAGLDEATVTAIVDDYEEAQLQSLKAGLLAAAVLALVSLVSTRGLPGTVTDDTGTVAGPRADQQQLRPSRSEHRAPPIITTRVAVASRSPGSILSGSVRDAPGSGRAPVT